VIRAKAEALSSHARLRGPTDLHLAIGGMPVPGGGRGFLLVDPNEKNFAKAWEEQRKLWDDARKINLFYWIDAHTKTVRHVINNDGARRGEACELMKIKGMTSVQLVSLRFLS
jgi:hypothetical protein